MTSRMFSTAINKKEKEIKKVNLNRRRKKNKRVKIKRKETTLRSQKLVQVFYDSGEQVGCGRGASGAGGLVALDQFLLFFFHHFFFFN